MAHDDVANPDSIIAAWKNAKPVPRCPYLEPEGSPFSLSAGMALYERILSDAVLIPAVREIQSLMEWPWQRDEEASVVCVPSFEPEWALLVAGERTAGFWIVSTQAQKSLWYSTNIWYSATSDPEIPSPPSVEIHRSKLAPALGGAVCDVWSSALFETCYPQQPLQGCDGVTYHFSYSRKGKSAMAGKTWSPEEKTVPGKLVTLSQALKDYANDPANDDVFLKVIEDHVQWFQTHFQQQISWRYPQESSPREVTHASSICCQNWGRCEPYM